MRVRLLAFASAAAALGGARHDLDLPDGSSVGSLRAVLGERSSQLAALSPRLAIAVDGEIAVDARTLADGCEVALLPPVSGG